jgi:hypothetical protein
VLLSTSCSKAEHTIDKSDLPDHIARLQPPDLSLTNHGELHLAWVQVFGRELDKRCHQHLRRTNRSWRLDETYINAKGMPRFLYRAVEFHRAD